MDTNSNSIAIIGVSGRFPGAKNVDAFWKNLTAGVESISFFSDEELAASGVDVAELKKAPGYRAARGMIEQADWFDAAFFNISAKEAEVLDPQQRLFLEAAWEVMEDAGYDPARVKGYVGVYAGMSVNSYYMNNLYLRTDLIGPGGKIGGGVADKDYLATRVAYKLNLKGPAISMQTACSTSLVAVCQACMALLCYQCDIALAGGASITFPQKRIYYPDGGMHSADGHCRPFDAQASGTVFSDALGMVALKRLDEALEDRDQIYAVIKGFGLNNDGSAKVGFAAPSVDGQAEVIALALAQAGVEADTISYIEAHGTATPMGDPIEIAALTQPFRASTSKKNFCAIGSVKGNIGHTDAAAGVTSLIKTALSLKHKMLPPSLHFTAPNPKIDFANSPFFVNSTLTEWKAGATPRRAGVSGFGVGGTNAHIVLEEAPPLKPSGPSRLWQLLPLSARTGSALDSATAQLCEHLKENPDLNLADAACTLQSRRRAFDHRRIVVCRDAEDAVRTLEARDPKRMLTQEGKVKEHSVVFMFPGQGAQYVNMGAELYRTERVFKEAIDQCAAILVPHLGFDLRQVLFPSAEKVKTAEELLVQTRNTQPALFVIEYALASLWMSWGVKPRAMIGHSVGEYVAACLAGVFTLEEALGVVAGRAQLVQAQPGGAMLAIRKPERDVAELLTGPLSIAAVNSPSLCVVSGALDAVVELESRLKDQGVAARRLQTSHAFHSPMMEPVMEPLTRLFEKVSLHKPSTPYISNVTGTWITDSEAMDPKYWASHLRQTVRFADGVGELFKDPDVVALEVGPGQSLSGFASQHPTKSADQVVISSFSAAREEDVPAVLTALGKLWMAGTTVDWSGFYQNEKRQHVALPTYPFERKRFWIEPAGRPAAKRAVDDTSASGATAVDNEFTDATETLPAQSTATDAIATDKNASAGSSYNTAARKEQILAVLKAQFQDLSGTDLSEVGPTATFIEMGLDSLFLGQALQAIETRFGVRISFRQLMEEITTLSELADYLDRKQPAVALNAAAPPATVKPAEVSLSKPAEPALDAIQAQLQALTRQVEMLREALQSKPLPAPDGDVQRPPEREQASDSQCLVRMRPGTSERAPFFCAHAADGNVLGMRPLAMAMSAEFPFYCLEPRGLDGSQPFESVEETARSYIEEIRKVQPHGAYHLGGYCYGGVVAFEMARMLEEMGEEVAALFLIDTYNPAYIRQFPMDPYMEEVVPGADTRFEETLRRLRRAGSNARRKYEPKPYGGSAVIFRASERGDYPYDDDVLGWKPVVRGAISCVEVEGNHDSIFKDPAVRLIAEKIDAKLRESLTAKETAHATGADARIGGKAHSSSLAASTNNGAGTAAQLAQVEALLAEHPLLASVVLVQPPDQALDMRPIAFIVPRGDEEPTAIAVRKHLRGRCPEWLIPTKIIRLESVPLTAEKTIDRARLAAMQPGNGGTAPATDSPRSETEVTLAAIWRAILKVPHVGVNNRFFELGGNSLLSIEMITRVERETAFRLSPRQVMFDTLGQIASRMAEERQKVASL